MKYCPTCNQTYNDEALNFCLNDGATLMHKDEAPPTIFMNQTRQTNPQYQDPTNFGANAPLSGWQSTAPAPNQPQYMSPAMVLGKNQTLPTVSLVLGILSLVICCYGGIPLGVPALITGYLGMSNVNKDPQQFGGKGLAIAGLACGAAGLAISLIVVLFAALGSIAK